MFERSRSKDGVASCSLGRDALLLAAFSTDNDVLLTVQARTDSPLQSEFTTTPRCHFRCKNTWLAICPVKFNMRGGLSSKALQQTRMCRSPTLTRSKTAYFDAVAPAFSNLMSHTYMNHSCTVRGGASNEEFYLWISFLTYPIKLNSQYVWLLFWLDTWMKMLF